MVCIPELMFSAVIYQCGLKRDLNLLEAGDATEVGEKGLTLRCDHIYPDLEIMRDPDLT